MAWTAPAELNGTATGISSATINSGAGALGNEIDNESTKAENATFKLDSQFGTAPTGVWKLWLLYAPDGTNYEDGGASTEPDREPDLVFIAPNATTAKKMVKHCKLRPLKFKCLLWNATNQNSTSSAVTLTGETYSPDPSA